MKPENLLPICQSQLTLVLSFFPRVDSLSSVLLAINTGMLAVLGATTPFPTKLEWLTLAIVLAFLFIALSLWHLYKGAFPRLEGGEKSLVYFREIAGRTESGFLSEFMKQDESAYVNDLLGQIWRNSQILTEKFNHLKKAFVCLALAVAPWALALLLNASVNGSIIPGN